MAVSPMINVCVMCFVCPAATGCVQKPVCDRCIPLITAMRSPYADSEPRDVLKYSEAMAAADVKYLKATGRVKAPLLSRWLWLQVHPLLQFCFMDLLRAAHQICDPPLATPPVPGARFVT